MKQRRARLVVPAGKLPGWNHRGWQRREQRESESGSYLAFLVAPVQCRGGQSATPTLQTSLATVSELLVVGILVSVGVLVVVSVAIVIGVPSSLQGVGRTRGDLAVLGLQDRTEHPIDVIDELVVENLS